MRRPFRARTVRLAALTATAAAGVTIAFAAPALATTTATASTTATEGMRLVASSTRVTTGSRVTLTATLTRDGHPVDGVKVVYFVRPNRYERWRPFTAARTNTEGRAAAVIRPQHSEQYTALTETSPAHGSNALSVWVTPSPLLTRVVEEAAKFNGYPYEYGAAGPNAFDCSGYTLYVWSKFGYRLPHNAAEQYEMAHMRHLAKSQMVSGDFIFFYDSSGIYHVAIYAGHGQMWAATRPGSTVMRQSIWSSRYVVGQLG
jgi:cell wall-associated NlpC family hydrolase